MRQKSDEMVDCETENSLLICQTLTTDTAPCSLQSTNTHDKMKHDMIYKNLPSHPPCVSGTIPPLGVSKLPVVAEQCCSSDISK